MNNMELDRNIHLNEESLNRSGSDRRRCPTSVISRYALFGGQRKVVRREEDKKTHLFVDLYSTRLLIAIILLLCLSSLDAFLTLSLLEKGKVMEANPVMAYVLNFGIMPFTIIKFLITSVALIILCVFKNVYITRVSLPIAIKIYFAVIVYELYLFLV